MVVLGTVQRTLHCSSELGASLSVFEVSQGNFYQFVFLSVTLEWK